MGNWYFKNYGKKKVKERNIRNEQGMQEGDLEAGKYYIYYSKYIVNIVNKSILDLEVNKYCLMKSKDQMGGFIMEADGGMIE